VKGVW